MPEEKTGDIAASPPVTTTADPAPPVESSPTPTAPVESATKTPAEPTVEDIVKGVLEGQQADSQPAAEGDEPSPEGTEKSVEEKPPSIEGDKGPVPYDRFKEVNDKAHNYEQELTAAKPLIEASQKTNELLQRNSISQEEYQDALDTLVLLKTDPKAGLEKLKPLMEQLAQFDDGYLPPDTAKRIQSLKSRVDEGELSPSAAKELEDAWRAQARFEAQARLGTKQRELTEKERQQQYMQSFVTAASQWDTSRRQTDPDYKPKAKPEDPDGLFEYARKSFMYEIGQNPVKAPADVVALLEKSYKDAKTLFSTRFAPKATKLSPNSRGSTSTTRKEPQTAEEVVADILKRNYGIVYTPRVAA